MTMNIRDLRERVHVQHTVLCINEKGELKESYTSSHDVWASIKHSGCYRLSHTQRAYPHGGKGPESSYTITVRYDPAFQKGTRIVGKESSYHVITSPTHDPYKRWTFMEASAFQYGEIDYA